MKLFFLRIFNSKFKSFEQEYLNLMESSPERFFKDGERVFSKKEKKWLALLNPNVRI